MLPVEPGDKIDATPWNTPPFPPGSGLQGGTHPNGDETANNDGWGAFSGTSAAAPQLAGAAALIKQACPRLKPAEIKDILRKTARDVTTGSSHPNTTGTTAVGPDTATGDGLVDAHKAVMLAKVRCLGPIIGQPIITQPIITQPPVIPPISVLPPIQPPHPIKPPILPITTPVPIQMPHPIAPIVNPGPVVGFSQSSSGGFSDTAGTETAPRTPGQPGTGSSEASNQTASQLSSMDVEALEDLIINSDFEME